VTIYWDATRKRAFVQGPNGPEDLDMEDADAVATVSVYGATRQTDALVNTALVPVGVITAVPVGVYQVVCDVHWTWATTGATRVLFGRFDFTGTATIVAAAAGVSSTGTAAHLHTDVAIFGSPAFNWCTGNSAARNWVTVAGEITVTDAGDLTLSVAASADAGTLLRGSSVRLLRT